MQKTVYPSLMFISQMARNYSHSEIIDQACQAGVRWVQLRMKDTPEEYLEVEAYKSLFACQKYGATFIINDNPELAAKVGAHGVHLGKNDISPSAARAIVGPEAIIGGTANTLEDILYLAQEGVDYIGLGPFRFTTTKKNLSPTLGLEGYQNLLQQVTQKGISLPVYAIGGILPQDFAPLMATGITGVAISGCLAQAEDMQETLNAFS